MEYQIAWEVFTNEEQAALKKAIELSLKSVLTQCVIEMTPQKEAELQKLADQMSPIVNNEESKTMSNFIIERLKQGLDPSPQSPEEEAELQKALDAEQLEKQKEFAEKNKAKEVILEKTISEIKVEDQEEIKKKK